ncbi:hypothetical protein [Nocardia fluminea]|uniref:Uncharacterized protein n=1 Tax=Nocardia fluminea TaxID=134984 RepID=A0A2N3WYG6_9NOCA|nr:hypothetical protein [Nocardia fluminea]PKV98899.1 hypothetical protein ATK86_0933 [Nocardia fluminea]
MKAIIAFRRARAVGRSATRLTLALISSAVLVATTALTGLVLEDWLPKSQDQQFDWSGSTTARLAATGGALLLLALVAWWITRSRQVDGTLYHLRLLNDRAPDIHAKAIARARERSLGYCSITRALPIPGDRLIDLTTVVAEARTELERAANTDDRGSSYEFAPNAHWPITFALGADWPLPESTTLLEFEKEEDFVLLDVSAALPKQIPELPLRTPEPEPDIRLVHLDIHFTGENLIEPANRERAMLRIFGTAADRTELWGVPAHSRRARCWAAPDDGRVPVRVTGKGLTPTTAAQATARAILQALDRYPNARIAVTARMPKIAATLTGRYFASHLQRAFPTKPAPGGDLDHWKKQKARYQRWEDPWRRLFLLSYHEPTQSMQVLRVHPRQPSAAPRLTTPPAGTLHNHTFHDLVIYATDNTILLTLPPTPEPARVTELRSPPIDTHLGNVTIAFQELRYAATPPPLPPSRPDTWLVVSRIAAHAWPDRLDLLFPIDEVRDPAGRIIGCRGLARLIDQP